MKKVKILYSSIGGNTLAVAQMIQYVLEKNLDSALWGVELLPVKLHDPQTLEASDVLVLASPTYGHGELEAFMAKWLDKLDKVALDWSQQKVAVVGLGEAKYDPDHVMESAKLKTKWLKDKGATPMHLPLMVAGAPFGFLENRIEKWAEALAQKIQA